VCPCVLYASACFSLLRVSCYRCVSVCVVGCLNFPIRLPYFQGRRMDALSSALHYAHPYLSRDSGAHPPRYHFAGPRKIILLPSAAALSAASPVHGAIPFEAVVVPTTAGDDEEEDEQQVVGSRLAPTPDQENLFPPAVWTVVSAPLFWREDQVVTPKSLARSLLAGAFGALDADLRAVGYFLVLIDEVSRATQPDRGHPRNYGAWWRAMQSHVWWQGVGADARQTLKEDAAIALFTNPPVSYCTPPAGGGGGAAAASSSSAAPPPAPEADLLHNACMVVPQSRQRCPPYIQVHHKYPYMVLGKDRHRRQVRIRVAILVAWLFHGAYPVRNEHNFDTLDVCCHWDMPIHGNNALAVRNKVQHAATTQIFDVPPLGRCLSMSCINPYCVFWSTQSYNAHTAHIGSRKNLKARKRHMKF